MAGVEEEDKARAKSLPKKKGGGGGGNMEKELKKGAMKSKSPADLAGGVLGCREFHSSFRTTQGPTRTWIIYSDFAQTMQSLV